MVSSFQARSGRAASLLLVGALLFAFGCGDLLAKRSTGESLYRKNCADCHGLDGNGHTIRYMGNPNANLTDSSWKYGGGDNVAIQNVLLQGLVERHPSSLQELESNEVKAIADWVLELRGEVSR
jgi:mono/diheme cytochrome c family protein